MLFRSQLFRLRYAPSARYVIAQNESNINLGKNHPQTIRTESELASLKSKLASETYSFTAQSRSMLLDGEQSDKLTVTLPTAMGAWQLVEQVLQPLGFSIERTAVAEWVQTPEWTLAAQSASWVSVTPMAIISSIAKACGAVVMPHMTDDKLIIAPRYRVSPSKWATAPASAWSP